MEIDSYFDETDAIENDEVEANIIIDDNELHNFEKKIDDNELHNLDENGDSDIPRNNDEPLPTLPETSKNVEEKQPQEYRWPKIDFDIL